MGGERSERDEEKERECVRQRGRDNRARMRKKEIDVEREEGTEREKNNEI